jgi:hypothetical protein
MCGAKIFECMGFALARDVLVAMRAALAGQRSPIRVRELCGRCELVWGQIVERAE